MAQKPTKAQPRYVVNTKLPKDWNHLLQTGDFFQLSRMVEQGDQPRGFPSDQYEAFRQIGRVDRVELGIALLCMASIIVTFLALR